MLTVHPSAAIEYWFFKVNCGAVALLVDWIARRRSNEYWLRVSIHSPYKREVLFERLVEFMPDHQYLSQQHTVGKLGDVAWDLDILPGRDWIKPDIFPAALLRMTDVTLVSAPLASFSGWIRHDGQLFTLANAPGMVSQYWGRQLLSEWWWISANQFNQPGIAVECGIFKSTLWGTSIKLPLAYLYLSRDGKQEFSIAPVKATPVEGTPEQFTVEIQPIGARPVTLTGTGCEYGDLGDGIMNTLVGDLEIRVGGVLVARADGTACLERRLPNNA